MACSSWLKKLVEELNWSFVLAMVIVYGINQGFGMGLSRVSVPYYMKDEQKLQPSEAQIYSGIIHIPWIVKPLWGLLTDTVSIFGFWISLIMSRHSASHNIWEGGCISILVLQENFGVVKYVVEKIAAGFRNNYMSAKEKVTTDSSSVVTKMNLLQFPEDESEFEWMKDDRLREIVFQVRENELMGRDPFYSMDAEDKCVFIEGLENKVVKENEKVLHLHEYLHSNIQNLYYGADGISLHYPPEKIVPRWKGTTTIEKDREFLGSYWEERKAFVDEKALTGIYPVEKRNVQEEEEEESRDEDSSSAEIKLKKNSSVNKKGKIVVIDSSDGFVKAGKKSRMENWQHTKKWSRGFLESYNVETDPEVKSEMQEIVKDLDRWITDKEIEEAADLINKLPERNKKFIEKKLDKVKREMELFGPQQIYRVLKLMKKITCGG